MKKILFMVLTALFLIAGCGDLAGLGGGTNTEIGGGNTGGGSDGDIKVERVDVDKTYIELNLQANKQLKYPHLFSLVKLNKHYYIQAKMKQLHQ